MIHRTYIAALAPDQGGQIPFPNLDIAVLVPGTRLAPVADASLFPPGTAITPPPSGWVAANSGGAYFELRGRAIPFEKFAGVSGFTPRTNLAYHLSICALQEPGGTAMQIAPGLYVPPPLSLSASLAAPPSGNAAVFGTFADPFPDPGYGPVIRVWNSMFLHSGDPENPDPLYLINFMIAENKDEDFSVVGHR
jgi:hypothetical protein